MQNQFEIENGILKAYLAPDAEVVIPEGVHTITVDVNDEAAVSEKLGDMTFDNKR